MDVLLSLPIVSYLLAPAVTSWSTSLNLLFFYLTWSTLILSYSPLRIELFGTLAIRIIFWLLPSLLFLTFDIILPSLAESIKFGGSRALPPRDAKVLGKTLLLALLNLTLETALEAGISLGLTTYFRTPFFKTSTTLPLPWQLIKQVVSLIMAREALTYYIHRYTLHSNKSPRASSKTDKSVGKIANLHGKYAHARSAPPFSLALAADHPVPFLLHRFLPIYLPALVIRPHLLTYFLFVVLVTGEETLSMSGYNIVPGIIMGGMARRCAIHYSKGHTSTSGNYGAWGLLDWSHGTSLGKDAIDDMKDEAEKHQLKERGGRAASDAMDTINEGIGTWKKGRAKGRKGKKTASESESESDSDFIE
ncbi:putative sterol desaturase family protein [Phaeoacremonium minimum UCRPA7]|uniref:Putative sterol desaturase family protein n=1 Tax=Phaeoacremonium minimum (strain UCR-PA7) TaxID=1286976 RepID=R8BAN0_PHAM7|nr:putative sterol desaturase family protein [Phaeoacremonium minimum UCRPA7]EON96355.1 putative sterol desaturase family protein [Phaeoacremonium minimum UCRPA7]